MVLSSSNVHLFCLIRDKLQLLGLLAISTALRNFFFLSFHLKALNAPYPQSTSPLFH